MVIAFMVCFPLVWVNILVSRDNERVVRKSPLTPHFSFFTFHSSLTEAVYPLADGRVGSAIEQRPIEPVDVGRGFAQCLDGRAYG